MSASPPPMTEDGDQVTSEIDLAGTDDINFSTSPDSSVPVSEEQSKKQVLSDDLFFSAISEPPISESLKATNEDDMDEIFKTNAPKPATKEIRLDEDNDPFSFSNNKETNSNSAQTSTTITNGTEPASINVQPVLNSSKSTNEVAKFTSLSSQKPVILNKYSKQAI